MPVLAQRGRCGAGVLGVLASWGAQLALRRLSFRMSLVIR